VQGVREGGGLDREGGLEALLRQGAHKGGRDAQIGEGRGGFGLLCARSLRGGPSRGSAASGVARGGASSGVARGGASSGVARGGASLVGRARGGSGHEESPRVGGHRRGSGPLGRSAASMSAMAGAFDRGPDYSLAHTGAEDEECVGCHSSRRGDRPAGPRLVTICAVRFVFTGDSITDCDRDRQDNTSLGHGYVALIAPELPGEQIINTGVSGDRFADLQLRRQRDGPEDTPDVLSVMIGINDTWRRYVSDDPTSVQGYEQSYRDILTRAQYSGIGRVILIEPFLLPVRTE